VPSTSRPPSDTAEERAARRGAAGHARVADRRTVRRRRLSAAGLLALVAAAVAVSVTVAPGGTAGRRRHETGTSSGPRPGGSTGPAARPRPSSFAVGLSVLHLVDTSRTITLLNGVTESRPLLTEVRYPALGAPGGSELTDAPAASAYGPFPLVVFGHGFDLTPAAYAGLLRSWVRAGYVVAAPVFPLENADSPDGPERSDLTNQPADMSFVISAVLAASSADSGPLAGLVDPARIAVAGHSDGGDTALALAYTSLYRDPRVDAAVILSGALLPGVGGTAFPAGSPPLLAVQGTADTINPPSATAAFFAQARRPKYLLSLPGAEHLPPYTEEQPQLSIVERVTRAFLDGYLKGETAAVGRLAALGNVPGKASLLSEP
jgi:dienelactone hydrolase